MAGGRKKSIVEEGELGHKTWPAPRYLVRNATFKTASRLVENWSRYDSFAEGHLLRQVT
jgi:hypothetical protein